MLQPLQCAVLEGMATSEPLLDLGGSTWEGASK